MYCPHCGNPVSPTDRFCRNCGVDLGVEETIVSRTPSPPPVPPTIDRLEDAEETIISRAPLLIQPPPPSPAYEPPLAPPTFPTAPPSMGETGDRNIMLIVAVVLILLCCCCLIAILGGYMLFVEGILYEILGGYR